jgi:hypothetical protein
MWSRTLLLALVLFAACGEPAPSPAFQPVSDDSAAATEARVTETTTPFDLHVIDPTLRNPFDRP